MKKIELVSEAGNRIIASVHEVARKRGIPVQKVALRYALERFIGRLFQTGGVSPHLFFNPDSKIGMDPEGLTLKGGLVMCYAEELPPFEGRTTSDADFHLAAFPGTMEDMAAIMRNGLSAVPDPDDGLRFHLDDIRIKHDREERSGGTLSIPLQIGNFYLKIKTDMTFDVRPMHDRAPTLAYPEALPELGLPPAEVRRVPFEFMAADKFCAALSYGAFNLRLRDYADMRLLFARSLLDPQFLAETLAATARFNNLKLPETMDAAPGFSQAYAESKQARWEHERINRGYTITDDLPTILAQLRTDFAPALARAWELETLPNWASSPF